ncbi:DUF917 domain-containing protein [Caldanaerobacter subterraneus]|uniref:DUF917 domain-containing protein n=1 Tax=Caldanaerobacter subterraneus TaxID=911092 RepID=UPI003463E0D7
MKKLTRQDLYDILYGCTILGTGGGGRLENGISLIDKALEAGKEFILVDLNEVPDDALIACPYYCGSISPITPEEETKYATLPRIDEEPALRAFKILEEYKGQKFYGTISTELGGANTAVAFYVAAMMGIYIIDGDPAGRSVPELQHSTFFINKIPITPMAVVNEFGDAVIVKEVVDDFRAEALVRAMAVVSKNHVGVADHLAKGRELKNAVIPGAITYALKIGKAYRKAKEENLDLAQEIAKEGNGYVIFRGIIKDLKWEDKDGFTIGETYIEGDREFEGSEYKIWFKNENIISWRNGKIDVTVPDLICMVADDVKEPVTNPNFGPGLRVSVIGLPAPKEWRTEEGLRVFGPKHFGFDIEYRPIETMF